MFSGFPSELQKLAGLLVTGREPSTARIFMEDYFLPESPKASWSFEMDDDFLLQILDELARLESAFTASPKEPLSETQIGHAVSGDFPTPHEASPAFSCADSMVAHSQSSVNSSQSLLSSCASEDPDEWNMQMQDLPTGLHHLCYWSADHDSFDAT